MPDLSNGKKILQKSPIWQWDLSGWHEYLTPAGLQGKFSLLLAPPVCLSHTLSLVTTQLQSSGRKMSKKGQKWAYQSQETKSSFSLYLGDVNPLQTL